MFFLKSFFGQRRTPALEAAAADGNAPSINRDRTPPLNQAFAEVTAPPPARPEAPSPDATPSTTTEAPPAPEPTTAAAEAPASTATATAETPAKEEEAPTEAPPARGGGGRGRRSAYADRDLTEGSIPKNLWFLAWPQIIAGAMRTVDQFADLFWAGFIDFRAIAGIGISQQWASLFNTGRGGMDTAARAMISRAIGAKNYDLANHLAMQSILLNSIMSLVWIVPGIFFSEALLRVLGVSDALESQTLWYMRFRFLGSFPFMLTLVTSSTLASGGDTLTSARSQVINRVCNVAFMPFLVLGLGPLPHMGISGTGLAFFLAQLPGTFINFYVLFKGTSRIQLKVEDIRIDRLAFWRQIKLGIPASVTSMERSVAQMLVIGLISPFGDLALAAYALTQRLNNLVTLGQQGLGQATGIIVGQSLGAKKPERAKETVRWAMMLTVGLSVAVTILMMAFPRPFMIIFTRDKELLDYGSDWLRIMALGFLVGGLSTVFVQAINTAGDTMIPMIVTLGTIWFVQQPAAAILSGHDWAFLGVSLPFTDVFHMGSFGVAWAMVLAQAVRVLFYWPYYLSGRWLNKQIL